MRRTTTAVLACLLLVGTLAAVPLAMAQQTDTEQATTNTSENATVEPGAQLSGVVGVQEAELGGEVESRAFGIRIANANSSDAKAAVVAEQLNKTEQRVAALEAQRAELQQARENGSMSEGEYRARTATLYAQSQNTARLANQTNDTASQLPAATLEANGVNVTAIRALSDRTANLTGPETAAIARTIAGDNPGSAARPDAAGNRTGGDAAGNRTGGDVAGNQTGGDAAGNRTGGDAAGNRTGGDAAGNRTDSDDTTSGQSTPRGGQSSGDDGSATNETTYDGTKP